MYLHKQEQHEPAEQRHLVLDQNQFFTLWTR